MIDANRLSHSLATALKDRPHGIPVQPNRSLPLRPPPPPPVRISVTKSPKNSPLTQPTTEEIKISRNGAKRSSVYQDGSTKEGSLRIDNDVPSRGVVGMNFYDSQEKEENSHKTPGVDESCYSKSLDHEESDESSSGENRRKSFESRTISSQEHSKKRKSSNSDPASPDAKSPKEKKRRGSYKQKRKSSSAEDNSDGPRMEKSPKIQKFDTSGTPKSKSKNLDRVESSGMGLPTIIRSRNSKSPRTEAEESIRMSHWRRTSTNSYKLIRPKLPPGIPKCPVAIPIEVAQAINLNDLPSSRTNGEANDPDTPSTNSVKPKIRIAQNRTQVPKSVEDLENTLPSMPSLELDLQNEILNGKSRSNATRQPVSITDAKLTQAIDDLSSKTNHLAAETVHEDLKLIHDHKFDQAYCDNSVVNQTMLQIHVLRYSPQMIILTTPQILPNGNVGVPDNGSMEPAVPEKLSLSIESGVDEVENDKRMKILDSVPIDEEQQYQDLSGRDQLRYILQSEDAGFIDTLGISQSQKFAGDESIGNKPEKIRKESQARSKVDLDKLKCRKNRLLAKLEKFYKEERCLKSKINQTDDPSRLTTLQQKMNCAAKKIENTQKYLDKVISIEKPMTSENPLQSRIQVRQDLVDNSSTEIVEPVRRSPFVPCVETDDEITMLEIPPVSSPLVITISESDASSDDDNYVIDEKLSDNVKSAIDPHPDMKIDLKHVPTNDVKSYVKPLPKDEYRADNEAKLLISPDVKIKPVPSIKEPEMTNNNVECTDKNLPSNTDEFPAGVNEALQRLPPLIPDPLNYSSKDLSRVAYQNSPNPEYQAQNLNSAPERFDKDQIQSDCNCPACLRGNPTMPVQNKDGNSYIPTPVINQTVNQENINTHPVTNYPGHQPAFTTTGNASSMFSRDNGGANINLSSPLQAHSALPLPPSNQRNLTAQGFPVPGEHSPNYQTTQWHNQHPVTNLSVPFTHDQDGAPHPSILAAHLLKSQAQEPVNSTRPTKMPSLMTEQFPTFGNWAAQMTRDTTARKPMNNTAAPQINPHPVLDHTTRLKATGSDMYKMAASAVDARHHAAGPANDLHWQLARTWSEQQRIPPTHPASQSNASMHRRDLITNPQNSQKGYMTRPGHQGSPVFVPFPTRPYHQTPSVPQNTMNMEYSGIPQNKQLQHYTHASSTRPPVTLSYQNQGQENSGHPVNSLAMMQNKYIQPPPYNTQSVHSQWMSANNYSKQQYELFTSQYNGYGLPTKPTDNSAYYTTARQSNKNSAPLYPVRGVIQQRQQLVPNVTTNAKSQRKIYSNGAVQSNRVIQDGFNEPLDLGRSSAIPQPVTAQNVLVGRLNNLKCSLCGTIGPKFNCIDCEAAFYCNANCQAQHWGTHFLECSQRMPRLKKVS